MIKTHRFFFYIKKEFFLCINVLISSTLIGATNDSIIGGVKNPIGLQNNFTSSSGCLPVFSFKTPDPYEMGIAADGINLWTSGKGPFFYKVNSISGAVIDSIAVPVSVSGIQGGDIDFDGSYLFSICEQDGVLSKTDVSNGNVVSQYSLPNHHVSNPMDPNNFGIALDNQFIWTTEYLDPVLSSWLFKHDASTLIIVDSFYLSHAVLPVKIIDGELWGIAFDVPYAFKINRSTGQFIDSIPWCLKFSYGFAKNTIGFWSSGTIPGNNKKVHRFETTPVSTGNLPGPAFNFPVHPNPATSFITIDLPGPFKNNNQIIIKNLSGTIMKTIQSYNNHNTIDISGLVPGAYFLVTEIQEMVDTYLFLKVN